MGKRKSHKVFCCICNKNVYALKVKGDVIYPHRSDLYEKVFYQCQKCKGYVGSHGHGHNTPLGVIASKEIKNARQHIHKLIDPLWKSKRVKRGRIYKHLSRYMGFEYHTAHLKTIEECRKVYKLSLKFIETLDLEDRVNKMINK